MKIIKKIEIEKPEKVYNLHVRNNNNYVANGTVVSNCHGVKSHELKKILCKATNAYVRLGFTGTMHAGVLDNWNTKSFLGPVLKEFSSGFLAEQGYISKCNINMLDVEYLRKKIDGTYDEVKDIVFTNEFRMNLIKDLTNLLDHNVLLLVGKVEKEGDVLEEYLKNELPNKEVVFLSGKDSVEVREQWRNKCVDRNDIVMIATYGIFQQGINIPNLKYIILAAPFKSKIRVLQSVGRALRKHSDKKHGAYIFDIHDHTNFFDKHGEIRYKHYRHEKFNVTNYLFEEQHSGEYDIEKIFKSLD